MTAVRTLDLAGPGFLVETLDVTRLAHLQRRVDKTLDERKPRLLVQLARHLAVLQQHVINLVLQPTQYPHMLTTAATTDHLICVYVHIINTGIQTGTYHFTLHKHVHVRTCSYM